MNASNETQSFRRFKYGFNVFLAAVVALAIVVAMNWLMYRYFWRFDLTSTRQYSLSPQTKRVMDQLEDEFTIITAFDPAGDPNRQRVYDLVDDYGRYSGSVNVDHMDQLSTTSQERLFEQVRSPYREQIEAANEAIEQGRAALKQVSQVFTEQSAALKQAFEHPQLGQGTQARQLLEQAVPVLSQMQRRIQSTLDSTTSSLEAALPPYTSVIDTLTSESTTLNENFIAPIPEAFEAAADEPDIPQEVQNALLQVAQRIKPLGAMLSEATTTLRNTPSLEDYDQVRRTITSTESLVVVSQDGVRALDIVDMFRRQANTQDPEADPELTFLGEELITGTLLSMTLDPAPLIVFVTDGQTTAMGPRGQYEAAAERLRNLNMDVREWSPAGRMTQFGPQPGGPPPQPAEGQKAVWVVLPTNPPDPRNPQSAQTRQQIADFVSERLRTGDGVLLTTSPDPASRFGQANPLIELLKTWDITAQTDQLILSERQLNETQSVATPQFEISDWNTAFPVTEAVSGLPGVLTFPSPIQIEDASAETGEPEPEAAASTSQVTHYPMIRLTEERMWTTTDLGNFQDASFNEETSADEFVVAAAAERGQTRLIVVSDPGWAVSDVLNYGYFGPGSASLTGAAFPANGELFVNSVYWLADLDELIAAGARTQDVRRIQPMDESTLYGWRIAMPIAMPVAVLVVGIGVWLIRRKA